MKIGKILTAIMLTGVFYMAQAHMFWVDGANDEKLGKFIANMGYSDDFLLWPNASIFLRQLL